MEGDIVGGDRDCGDLRGVWESRPCYVSRWGCGVLLGKGRDNDGLIRMIIRKLRLMWHGLAI